MKISRPSSKQKGLKLDDFYAARDSKRPPLQWTTFTPPFTETVRRWVEKFGSYDAALSLLGLKHLEDVGGWKNNRTECSHVPIRRRERKAQKFRSEKAAQRFFSSHGQIYNLFNYRRHLISRLTLRKFRTHAQSEWSIGTAAACN